MAEEVLIPVEAVVAALAMYGLSEYPETPRLVFLLETVVLASTVAETVATVSLQQFLVLWRFRVKVVREVGAA